MLALDEPTGAIVDDRVPCYTGSDADPEELRALRSAPGLVDDGVRAHRSSASSTCSTRLRRGPHYWKGHFVRELPDELVDELLVERMRARAAARADPDRVAARRAEGRRGARRAPRSGFARPPSTSARWAGWQDAALDDEEQIDWARETAAAIEPWSIGGGYVNYMQADEPIERVRAAFGDDAFERLQALKGRYDPGNVLRRNQNIPPPRD